MKNTKMKPPSFVLKIVELLLKENWTAYLVGGCVRDFILQREPTDWDISTNALPETIMELFKNNNYNVVPTGLKHGTITVGNENGYCEITTFRIDGHYTNGRKPDNVDFTNDILQDLSRRDFTMNAIAYQPFKNEYIDPFNGMQDIQNKMIRAVGDPYLRFCEDPLRILRALRFSCVLNFDIENETKKCLRSSAFLIEGINTKQVRDAFTKQFEKKYGYLKTPSLAGISRERIRDEFFKILGSNKKFILEYLRHNQVLQYILPEFEEMLYNVPQNNPWHIWDLFRHTDVVLNETNKDDLVLRLAAIFHDIGKAVCVSTDCKNMVNHFYDHPTKSVGFCKVYLSKHLKVENKITDDVCSLIQYHDYELVYTIPAMKRLMLKLSNDVELSKKLVCLKIADLKGQNIYRPEVIDKIQMLENNCFNFIDLIVSNNEIPTLKNLAINGTDLLENGYSQLQGKQIGEKLKELLEFVIKNPDKNTKEILLSMI